MDRKTERAIKLQAKALAGFLVRHPVLQVMVTSKLAEASLPITHDNKAALLEATARELNRMVNGS